MNRLLNALGLWATIRALGELATLILMLILMFTLAHGLHGLLADLKGLVR